MIRALAAQTSVGWSTSPKTCLKRTIFRQSLTNNDAQRLVFRQLTTKEKLMCFKI